MIVEPPTDGALVLRWSLVDPNHDRPAESNRTRCISCAPTRAGPPAGFGSTPDASAGAGDWLPRPRPGGCPTGWRADRTGPHSRRADALTYHSINLACLMTGVDPAPPRETVRIGGGIAPPVGQDVRQASASGVSKDETEGAGYQRTNSSVKPTRGGRRPRARSSGSSSLYRSMSAHHQKAVVNAVHSQNPKTGPCVHTRTRVVRYKQKMRSQRSQ